MNSQSQLGVLTLRDYSTYLWMLAFVAGNVLGPQLCHIVPMVGKMLLPIMLFTMIAAVRFGLSCAMLTAIVSPLISSLVFGMPTGIMLAAVLMKSLVIALVFGFWRERKGTFTIWNLLALAVGVQLFCFVTEGAFMFGFATSWANLLISWPGVIIQVGACYFVLKRWR